MNLPKVHEYRSVPLQCLDAAGRVVYGVVWPLVVWHVEPGAKVSQAIIAASELYALQTGQDPQIALIHAIPPGAEEFVEVRNVVLIQAGWVEPGFVLVGRPADKLVEVEWKK
jgi:hypothetical protein